MKKRFMGAHPPIRDYGGEPFVFNINHATERNENFRTTLWTGRGMQLTLMSIPRGQDIGAEMHGDVDQFLRIVSGTGKVYIGDCKGELKEAATVNGDCAILLPAGTWHNVVNVGSRPLKLYSLYAPPEHQAGTVHRTKEAAEEAEA